MQPAPDWQHSLGRLPLQWLPALLPIGPDKQPLDPATGRRAGWKSWPQFSAEALALAPAVGLRLGPISDGTLALDFDGADAPGTFQEIYGRPWQDLPRSVAWTSTKPDRRQISYRVPEHRWPEMDGRAAKVDALEFRWAGQQSVILGAHPETDGYRWLPGCAPWEVALADAPDWLLDLMPRKTGPPAPLLSLPLPEQPGVTVPLREFLAKWAADLIERGSTAGSCNDDGLRLALELVAVESWLTREGARPNETARDAYGVYLQRCPQVIGREPFNYRKGWARFDGAAAQQPTPATPGTKLRDRLAFHRRATIPGLSTTRNRRHDSLQADSTRHCAPPPELLSDEDRRIAGDAAAAITAAGSRCLALDQVLPQGLAGPLIDRAAAFPCDPMAFLLPLLCTTASVIGNRMEVRVKATWREPFVLWAANVMPASSLKSPIASVILKPLSKWQVELNKVKKREKAEYNSSCNQIALQGDKERLSEWESENPPPLPARELFIIDATLEKIGQMLGQPETCGMVAYHDELTLWFQQLKRGKDALDQRSNWLSLWTGGLLKVDRIGRDSIYIPNTAQSVFGLSTVDGLRIIQSSGKPSDGNQDADGLWARFLLWQPRDVPYVHNDLDRDVTDLLLNTFRDRIDALVPPLKEDQPPAALSLTADGIAMMAQHWTAWDALARETTKERGQWLGKLRGHSVRIAGLLHVLDCAAMDLPIITEVSTDAARRSLLLCHALLDQYDFLHAGIGSDADGLDPAVAKLLARGVEWRRTHGDDPVPMEQLRRWKLPTRDASAADRHAWLAINVAANDRLGRTQTTARSITWLPPVN